MLRKLLNLDAQYRRPSGLVGRWVGEKMADQHRSENLWTVHVLDVQPTDTLLEIGFGPGFAIQEISQHLTTGKITGVDFSQTMVSAAKRRNAQAIRAGRVEIQYAEVTHLPFADNTFDKAFSINSVYFWLDPLAAFKELYRVLKAGGSLTLTFLPTERWQDAPTAADDFRPYSAAEIQSLLTQAGFTDLHIAADPDLQNRANYSVTGIRE